MYTVAIILGIVAELLTVFLFLFISRTLFNSCGPAIFHVFV